MMHTIYVRTRDSQQWVKFAEFKSFNKALKMTYKVANKYPQLSALAKNEFKKLVKEHSQSKSRSVRSTEHQGRS